MVWQWAHDLRSFGLRAFTIKNCYKGLRSRKIKRTRTRPYGCPECGKRKRKYVRPKKHMVSPLIFLFKYAGEKLYGGTEVKCTHIWNMRTWKFENHNGDFRCYSISLLFVIKKGIGALWGAGSREKSPDSEDMRGHQSKRWPSFSFLKDFANG